MNQNTLPIFLIPNVIVVIEEALKRLNILHSTNEYLISHSSPKKTSNKLDINISFSEDQPEGGKKAFVEPYLEKILNIEFDRQFVENALVKLKSDLFNNGEYSHFSQIVQIEQENIMTYDNQGGVSGQLTQQVDSAQDVITRFQMKTDFQRSELARVVKNLKNEKQELIQKRKMELKLVQCEMQQRLEQLEEECSNESLLVNDQIKKYFDLHTKENKVHKFTVEEFRHGVITVMNNEDKFVKYYHEKRDAIVGSISFYTKNSIEQKKNLKALSKKHKEYHMVVLEDREWKKELNIELTKQNILTNYAKALQNWWRWIVVRDNLMAKQKKKSKKKKK